MKEWSKKDWDEFSMRVMSQQGRRICEGGLCQQSCLGRLGRNLVFFSEAPIVSFVLSPSASHTSQVTRPLSALVWVPHWGAEDMTSWAASTRMTLHPKPPENTFPSTKSLTTGSSRHERTEDQFPTAVSGCSGGSLAHLAKSYSP